MPEDQEEQKPGQPTPVKRLSANHVQLYINQTEFALTPWDIQLLLSNVHGEGSSLIVEEVGTLVMSPQHAKAFALALITNVGEWERTYGEIKLPERIITKATGASSTDGESEGAEQPATK